VRRRNARYIGRSSSDSYGLDTLTSAERVILGPLIRGQFIRNPRIEQDIAKNGLAAMARLCTARSLLGFEFILVIVASVLAIAGFGPAASVFAVLFLVNGGLGIIRAISATRAQKRWRSEQQELRKGGA
jgi:hypothetical protein